MTLSDRVAAKPSAVYKNRMQRYADDVWLIWSNKWGCWYRDNSAGYTSDIAQAGLYNRAKAEKHYTAANLPKSYRDTEPFPLSSVREMLLRRRDQIEIEAADKIARINDALNGRLAHAKPE